MEKQDNEQMVGMTETHGCNIFALFLLYTKVVLARLVQIMVFCLTIALCIVVYDHAKKEMRC